jgi:transposase
MMPKGEVLSAWSKELQTRSLKAQPLEVVPQVVVRLAGRFLLHNMGDDRDLLYVTLQRLRRQIQPARPYHPFWAGQRTTNIARRGSMQLCSSPCLLRSSTTTVAGLLRIAWLSVGRMIERVTRRLGGDPGARLKGRRRIGIDELSYEKNHKYVKVVTDHDRGRVVWVVEGKDAAALNGFFDALGPEGIEALEIATIDMSGAFKKAFRERAPNVEIVFDRFHVQRLVHEALDEVRRTHVNAAAPDEKAALKKTRFILQRAPGSSTPSPVASSTSWRPTITPSTRPT